MNRRVVGYAIDTVVGIEILMHRDLEDRCTSLTGMTINETASFWS